MLLSLTMKKKKDDKHDNHAKPRSTMSAKDSYIGLFIESDLKTQCEEAARAVDMPLSMLVRKALKAYLIQISGEVGTV